jgi:hypothetical protein
MGVQRKSSYAEIEAGASLRDPALLGRYAASPSLIVGSAIRWDPSAFAASGGSGTLLRVVGIEPNAVPGLWIDGYQRAA